MGRDTVSRYGRVRAKLLAMRFVGGRASVRYLVAWAGSLLRHRPTPALETNLFHAGSQFRTSHSRPKGPTASSTLIADCPLEQFGIVIQGPIEHRSDFTLNTVLSYRRQFPAASIVVSTWENEPVQALRTMERAGALVVTDRTPLNGGPYNHNLQMTSTANGVHAVKQMGLEYCLRARSDQRMYSSSSIPAMWAALNTYPLDRSDLAARGRIVTSSLDSFRYRLYGVSDQLHFGYTEDIARFWDGHQDDRPSSWDHPVPETLRDQAMLRLTEVYFCSRYLERIGWQLAWSLADSWAAFRDCFVVLDSSSLDLFWPKYSALEYRWRRYSAPSPLEEFTFSDWLILYATGDVSLAHESEDLLDRPGWSVPVD